MLQMTRHINADWQPHVGATGVTCYTCHRGNNVPKNIWFNNPGPEAARGMAGNHAGQNTPGTVGRLRSLPFDPFTPFLEQDERHPRRRHDRTTRRQPAVHQADRMDLRA